MAKMWLILTLFFACILISINTNAENYSNLIRNPGFDTLDGWKIYGAQGGITQDKNLMLNGPNGRYGYAHQKLDVKLIPGRSYLMSVMFKTTPTHNARMTLCDDDWYGSGTSPCYEFYIQAPGNNEWRNLERVITIPFLNARNTSTEEDTWSIYLYSACGQLCGDDSPVYYDNANLTLLPEENYFNHRIGIVSENNAVSLDFGNVEDEQKGVAFFYPSNPTNFTIKDKYRFLEAGESVRIDIKAFNFDDATGLPRSPMILEIGYLDVNIPPDIAIVSSGILFTHTDPLAKSQDISRYSITALGKDGSGKYRYIQYGFSGPDSPFQLIRAIPDLYSNKQGKYFVIWITRRSGFQSQPLPIDYITLKVASQSEINSLRDGMKRENKFKEASMPPDRPASPVQYDNTLTVFVRDPMRPIYRYTKPKAEEIASHIRVTSAPGETEPITFGLYSPNGVNDLEIEISDLVNNNSVIPADNIDIKKVVYQERRLGSYIFGDMPSATSYALLPDYLDDVGLLDIESDESVRIWMKAHIPENLGGGIYNGRIRINQNGKQLKSIGVSLELLPLMLDEPAHMNIVHSDPFTGDESKLPYQSEDLMSLCREAGLEPFIWEQPGDVVYRKDAQGKCILDTAQLEAKVKKMVEKGVIRKRAVLLDGIRANDIFSSGCIDENNTNLPLYEKLSTAAFQTAYGQRIQQLMAIAGKYGFEFYFACGEEPMAKAIPRVQCDRINTIVKKSGGLTYMEYHKIEDEPLISNDTSLSIPNGVLPGLTDLVDMKAWVTAMDQDYGYDKRYKNFGYFTNNLSPISYPFYNRFMHGLLAFATDAKLVAAYSMQSVIVDPYNEFDRAPGNPLRFSDTAFVYPSWDGNVKPRLNFEGLREGIKDAKYIATLKRLINEHSNLAITNEAAQYLNRLYKQIDPYFEKGYIIPNQNNPLGYYSAILKNVSPDGDANDFEAFTKVRSKIIQYIKAILNQKSFNKNKWVWDETCWRRLKEWRKAGIFKKLCMRCFYQNCTWLEK